MSTLLQRSNVRQSSKQQTTWVRTVSTGQVPMTAKAKQLMNEPMVNGNMLYYTYTMPSACKCVKPAAIPRAYS